MLQHIIILYALLCFIMLYFYATDSFILIISIQPLGSPAASTSFQIWGSWIRVKKFKNFPIFEQIFRFSKLQFLTTFFSH